MASKEDQKALDTFSEYDICDTCLSCSGKNTCSSDCKFVQERSEAKAVIQKSLNYLEKLEVKYRIACNLLAEKVEMKNKNGDIIFPRRRYWEDYIDDIVSKGEEKHEY